MVVYNLSTTQEVEAGELSLIWGQSVLCYNVKLQPAYSLKRIKSLKRILRMFLPGCLQSYFPVTALSKSGPTIFLVSMN